MELTFADEGIDVFSVGDGDAAMQKFVEIEPDLVIADVNMPGMSGYQLCEMIKQDESTRDIPVILLVGSFEPFDPGEASRVGCNYYFTKPFTSIRELVEKVKEYLALDGEIGAAPETVDIDDLYHRSISGEQVPAEEPLAVFDDMTTADAGPFATPVEVQAAEPEIAAAMPSESIPVLPPVELGDAGMDDEMIETSHPGADVVTDSARSLIDPFESTVPYFQAGEVGELPSTPLKFVLENEEPQPEPAVEPVHFAPRENIDGPTLLTPENTSAELIELIAERVIERLSDTAVREAAREAVPQIAEKLIREALDADKKG